MIIKKFSDIEPIPGFNRVETALLQENGIDLANFNSLFPDYKKEVGSLAYEIKRLSKLKKTNEFADYIMKNRNKKFCIVGDYDVDGILATTIMLMGLTIIGAESTFIIPNRLEDSYGISEKHIDRAIAAGAQILVTVDNGIGCKEAVKYAKSKGLDVLITDHHIPIEGCIPEDVLIIDPKFNDDEFVDICGANVAFKLMYNLLDSNGYLQDQENFFSAIEMAIFAGIATITDMMPSFGENRTLVKAMLSYVNMLKEKKVWGGRILKLIKGLGGSFIVNNPDILIDEDTFSFFVGPTMNALGRVKGDVERLVEDILQLPQQGNISQEYLQINRERKKYTQTLVESHKSDGDLISIEVFNASDYNFPVNGLVGLVANKILSTDNKVSLAGMIRNGQYEFSCRSPQGYSIHDGFERIKEAHPELQLDGGGHESAMGLKFPAAEGNLEKFKEYLREDFAKYSELKDSIFYQYDPAFDDEMIEAYNNFGLFGASFKKIKFYIEGPLRDFGDNYIKIGRTELEYHVPQTLYYTMPDALSKATFDIKFDINGAYFRLDTLKVQGLDF